MIGVFIEPEKSLKKFIIKWKNIIKLDFKNQKYVDHPPHLSLYVGCLKLNDALIGEISKKIQNFGEIELKINKSDFFFNDVYTKKDTIFLKVRKNKKLALLQLQISNICKKHLIYKRKKKIKFSDDVLNRSYLKYGFPFVGSHWIPHFTIASINNLKKKKI